MSQPGDHRYSLPTRHVVDDPVFLFSLSVLFVDTKYRGHDQRIHAQFAIGVGSLRDIPHRLGTSSLPEGRRAAQTMGLFLPTRPIYRSFAWLMPLTWRFFEVEQMGISHTTFFPSSKSRYNSFSAYCDASKRDFKIGRLSCIAWTFVGNRRAMRVRPRAIGRLYGTVDG